VTAININTYFRVHVIFIVKFQWILLHAIHVAVIVIFTEV